jgi:NAD(P)-dependent dehydrogenase (short-subunit alcohol dehydrogenase family)
MLAGLKVLVTGASSGIGRSTCQVMSSHGAVVVGIGRNEDNLKTMVQDKHISSYVVADLAADDECERAGNLLFSVVVVIVVVVVVVVVVVFTHTAVLVILALALYLISLLTVCFLSCSFIFYSFTLIIHQYLVNAATTQMGGLTTVVNSAGVLQGGGMDTATLDNFKYNFGTNVQATFEIMQHAIPHLKLSSEFSPSIINISSVNAKQAFKGCATYCASKAAVDQLSRCASLVSVMYVMLVTRRDATWRDNT